MKTLLILLAVYFCSPNGGGSGTSYNSPCSFSQGLQMLNAPGDTLYLRGGQYNLGTTNINLHGSSTRNIVIASCPNEWATLDFRTTPYGQRGLVIKSASGFVHIKDMALCYSGKNNLYCEGSNCIFENLDIYGSADTGCQMKGTGGNNLILNCDSHDNFDYENGTTSRADFGGNADGFADKQYTGPGNTYRGCRAWNNSDDGWDFYQRTSSGTPTIIENCICYKNGPSYYDMRNHARYQTDKTWFDQINGTTVTDRYGQQVLVTLENYPNQGNGNGFKLGGNYTSHNVLIHHCLALYNKVNGFDQNNNGGNMEVYNNTGYKNGGNYGFTTSYGTLTIRNCISYQSGKSDTHKSKTTIADDHNSWNNMSARSSDFVSNDTSLVLDNRQANGDLTENGLFALNAGSQYVDAGIDVGLFHTGTHPDLGWKELPGDTIWPTPPGPEPEYECKDGAYPVAYLTTPNDPRDKVILDYLKGIDSLCITILDAAEPTQDYSEYELLIISSVPSSTSAAIMPAKDATLPKLIFKTFVYKSSVWNWGTPNNTNLTSITIEQPDHIIFDGLSSPITLFSKVNTNAVTTVSNWLVSPVTSLATANGQDVVAEYDNTLTIGLSEYSTEHLTADALLLIENAIWYRMGRTKPEPTAVHEQSEKREATVLLRNGRLYIRRNQQLYTLTGNKA